MKKCFKCGKTKETTDFYNSSTRYDGLSCLCKSCDIIKRQLRVLRSPEPQRRKWEKWYEKNKERHLLKRKVWLEANRHKVRAHQAVKRAINKGRLVREACFCGEAKTDAHHNDYSKPLDVEWLCRRHHSRKHNPPAH